MAGRSPYEDVQEVMQIKVKGTSASDVLGNLRSLIELFDQANAWYDDPYNNTPVKMQIQPNGSSTTVDAVIWGADAVAPTNFTWLNATATYLLAPVTLTFTREPIWRGSTETKSASITSGNPAIATTAAFTNTLKVLAPYDIDVTFSGSIFTTGDAIVYVLTANEADKLYTIEAESMTGGSSTAVTAASAGNVHRQTASSGAVTLTDSSFALDSKARKFAFWAVVKPSGTTTTWTAQASLYYNDTHNEGSESGPVKDIAESTSIQIIDLGIIETGYQPGRFAVVFTPSSSSAETLDIDYICGVAIDDSSNIFNFTKLNTSSSFLDQFKVIQNLTTTREPQAVAYEASSVFYYMTRGGIATPYANGSVVSSLVFGIGPSAAKYTIYDNDNTQEANLTFSATRYNAYLAPI